MSQKNGCVWCGSAYLRISKFLAILLGTVFFCFAEQGAVFAADEVVSESIGGVEGGGASTTLPGKAPIVDGRKKIGGVVNEPSSQPMFVLAPILWGGDVSMSLHRVKFEQGSASLQTEQAGSLRATTYVWQPWFAQVSGGMGVVNSKNTLGTTQNKSVSWNGSGDLSLMPFSRFPFLASYYSSDRHADTGASTFSFDSNSNRTELRVKQRYQPSSRSSDSDISYRKIHDTDVFGSGSRLNRINSRLDIQHDYRSPRTSSIYGVGYSQSAYGGSGQEFSATTKMFANYTKRYQHHYFDVETINIDGEFAKEGSRNNQVTGRHTYRPDALTSVKTSGIVSQSELQSVGQNFTNTSNLQLASAMSWQPDVELPFYVSGNLRGFGTTRDTKNTKNISQGLLGVARVNYDATPNVSYRLSETMGVTRLNGGSTVTTVTGGSASYKSNNTKLGGVFHKWNASGSVDYHTSSKSSSSTITSGKAGQSLGLNQRLGIGALSYNFNQAVSVKDRGNSLLSGTLTNNGGVVWKPALMIKSLSGSGSINLVDRRTFGNTLSSSQNANLTAKVQHRSLLGLSRVVLGASVLWNVSNNGLSAKTFKLHTGLNHPRAFNVVGLQYGLVANASKYQANGPRGRANLQNGYSISQRLEYAVGRFYMKLNGDVVGKANVRYTLIVLKIGRTFGQY